MKNNKESVCPKTIGKQIIGSLFFMVFCFLCASFSKAFNAEFEPATISFRMNNVSISSMISADISQDGAPDVIVTLPNRNQVRTYHNSGTGLFDEHNYEIHNVGDYPYDVICADFNMDTFPDIAVSNRNDVIISILLHNGSDGFTDPANYYSGYEPCFMECGDFNGDNYPDIAVRTQSNRLAVLINIGDGTFNDPIFSQMPYYFIWFSSGDFNGDGCCDIAYASSYGDYYLDIAMNDGSGSFFPSVTLANEEFLDVKAADFNNDTYIDILAVQRNHDDPRLWIFLNDGAGSFSEPVESPGGAQEVFCADFNNDTCLDVAVACSYAIDLHINDGDGHFSDIVTLTADLNYLFGMAYDDFDNDGITDLTVGNAVTEPTLISVYFGMDTLVFNNTSTIADDLYPADITASDFNNDNHIDLAVIASDYPDSYVAVCCNDGSGHFQEPVQYSTEYDAVAITAGQLNEDSYPDIATITHTPGGNLMSVLLNDGSGSLSGPVTYVLDTIPGDIVSGDLDNDGDTDLAVSLPGPMLEPNNTVRLFMNQGNGTFDIGQAITVGISPEGIACGDLDQDGWLDLAVGNGVSQNISIMINTGDGEFVSKGEYTCGDGAEAVVIGNFNADALPDLAVALKRDNHYCILINEGGAVFNPPAEMTMPKGQNGLTTADFDNDGRDDIALAFRDNGIRLQMQAPDGSFLNPCYDFGTVKAARGICAADFDGDGPDIAMACHNNISILFNNFSNIPTPTPTPPNPCAETRVTISMPANMFTPGDVCSCTAVVCNAESTPLNGYPLFVILDVFGNLFFAPGFRQDFDNYLAMYPEWPTGETIVTVISSFNWPENTGYAQGVLWYGALTDPDVTTIVGEMGQFEFGWTP